MINKVNNTTSERLSSNISNIMNIWEQRALSEVKSAHLEESLALRNSLPDYLAHLASALSNKVDRTLARQRSDLVEGTRVGKKHGSERAGNANYTMDQMILEYHILRQVLFDVMEDGFELSAVEREVMTCSIEQAVNDAATQFSESVKEFQDNLSHALVHDLRNPLTIAKASAQLMLKKLNDPAYCEIKTNLIIKNINRIDKMIGELLDVSRQSAWDSLALDLQECDMDFILKEILEGSVVAHGDRFIYTSLGPCIGHWNTESVRRFMENLITNAVKYGSENTPINFKVEQTATDATFTIHNLGNPILESEQALLFDKYRRSKTSEKTTGWGLGLTIVKSMVESHQGTIDVKSSPEGGTIFKIMLPKNQILS
jgi:signal transduction histidine kinase